MLNFLFMTTSKTESLTCMGVASCRCTIYDNMLFKTMAYLDFTKRAAHSAPEDYAMKNLIICEMAIIEPLLSLW